MEVKLPGMVTVPISYDPDNGQKAFVQDLDTQEEEYL